MSKLTETQLNQRFQDVLKLVNKGFTIDNALIKLKLNANTFYRNIDDEQKNILKAAKMQRSRLKVIIKYIKTFNKIYPEWKAKITNLQN